ncbi:RsmE family RNA methyltransferase [Lacticaseibacillus zhaodongensis]|uniref:RsmE family RNA methyltransferase n=1 Tax=Lacticaseibacillus zhaodongensis TaxID=2668065 RepID=UPI0012D2BD3E|nr:16S rRNA (uracil(1498)-N(3))-methyltransferase [Lacticaseibacillus zhaodongensis]
MQRYFTDQVLQPGTSVQLDATATKHAVKVLRMQEGQQLELADAHGNVYLVTITGTDPLTVRAESDLHKNAELPVAVTIVCGVGKAQKPELITQKAVELGASRIVFANSQWATARWQDNKVAKKLERLQLVARGAAEQSHRNVVPTVEFLPKLTAASTIPADAQIIAYEESAKQGETAALVAALAQQPRTLTAVFGPEGGIAPEEVQELTAAGFVAAGLGPRILRTETAPLYLLSAISTITELMEGKTNIAAKNQ